MKITKTHLLSEHQKNQINQLWNDEFPVNLINRFDLLLEGVETYCHYLMEVSDLVIGWAVLFEKDNEYRFSIIVHEQFKGKGVGTQLIRQLQTDNHEFYGWVIDHNNDLKSNGKNYISPLEFYQKLNFVVLDDVRIDNKMLKAVKIKWKNNEHEQ